MSNNKMFQVSEIGLVYKSKVKVKERPQIKTSKDTYDIFIANWSEHIDFVEEFNILLLNRGKEHGAGMDLPGIISLGIFTRGSIRSCFYPVDVVKRGEVNSCSCVYSFR